MISSQLLKMTSGRALGFCIYGGPGMKKTLGVHTCPPPIELHELEGGDECLIPWTRRARRWDGEWENYSQEHRQQAHTMLTAEIHDKNKEKGFIQPGPYIDIIRYDSLDYNTYNKLVENISNFSIEHYNTFALDSLQEFAQDTQTFSKGGGRSLEPMTVNLWGPAQERAAILLRKIRNYRDKGIFVYLVGSEQIDKDYVTDPRETKPGMRPEEPYSVKGTVALPGKLAGALTHLVDIMLHARPLQGQATWVSQPEPLPGGSAHWEAKDRTGRIGDKFVEPNIRKILDQVYGEEGRRTIYAASAQLLSQG